MRQKKINQPAIAHSKGRVYVHYRNESGKRIRKYFDSGTTEERENKAKEYLDTILTKLKKEPDKDPKASFQKCLNEYCKKIVMGKRDLTQKNYISTKRTISNFFLDREFNANTFGEFTAHLENEYSQSTRHAVLAVYKKFFLEQCPNLPAIKLKKPVQTPAKIMSKEHVKKLLAYAKLHDFYLYTCLVLIIYCFLRPREICRLEKKDFLGDNIFIDKSKSKNKKSARISVNTEVQETLNKHIQLYPKTTYLVTAIKRNKPSQSTYDTINNRYKKALKKLELDGLDYSLYSLRHFSGKNAIEKGYKVYQLQKLYRHSNLAQTLEYLRQNHLEDLNTEALMLD